MKNKTSKKKHTFLKGCLGIFLIAIAAFLTFILWPMPDDDSVVLSDKFDNNDNNWTLGDYASIKNGQLIIAEGDISVIPINLLLKNGRISVNLSYISGSKESEYGIIFRDIDDEQFNFFLISSDSSQLARLKGKEDGIYDKNGFIKSNAPNFLTIKFYGRLIRIFINETLISESYDDNPGAGTISLYSSGGSIVAFDDLEIIDYDQKAGNITGSVIMSGDKLSAAELIAWQLIEPDTLGVVEIARTVTNDQGEYSFFLPEDSSYFIESGTPDKKYIGDRYTDLQIPDSGLNLDITISEVK
jgi:hypothetical protein